MKIRLPGVCQVCRADIVWNGRYWRDPGVGRTVHVCPDERPTCGAWMRNAKERCARWPGHLYEHRSLYAISNQWTPSQRCNPPECVLPEGHMGTCRSRYFLKARRKGEEAA